MLLLDVKTKIGAYMTTYNELTSRRHFGISRRKQDLNSLESSVSLDEQDQPIYEGTSGELTIYFVVPQNRPKFGLKKTRRIESN